MYINHKYEIATSTAIAHSAHYILEERSEGITQPLAARSTCYLENIRASGLGSKSTAPGLWLDVCPTVGHLGDNIYR